MDVRHYVNSCDCCQYTNPKLLKLPARLHPIAVISKVWHCVEMELIGSLKMSRRGNCCNVTCTNYFLNWVEAQAIADKDADTVAKFLFGLISRFGCFSICLTDQGQLNQLNHA